MAGNASPKGYHPGMYFRSPRSPLLAICFLLAACGEPEPVLPGVPSGPLVPAAPRSTEPEAPRIYELPPGVMVDVQYLVGHPLSQVRAEVLTQLGSLVSSTELPPGRGEELQMERGTIRALEDRIYMLRIPLPNPMRRSEVLRLIGLPPQVGETIQTHREYRLNHERGIRRIRMMRQSRRNELVTEVEVWQFIPGEHVGRR